MSTSKLQRQVSFALSTHFGQYTIRENTRPNWLRGEHYERLELDFWIEDLDVAIEVQGDQHYVYTPHFHGNYEGFKAQEQRDEIKRKKCVDYRILLLEVSDQETLTKAINVVYERAKADQILTVPQRRRKKAERRFNHICQMYRDFWTASSHLSDQQFQDKAAFLERRAQQYMTKVKLNPLTWTDDPRYVELTTTMNAVRARLEDIWTERTISRGYYPGEEIVFLDYPRGMHGGYCEQKGFIIRTQGKKLLIHTINDNGRLKTRLVNHWHVLPAVHMIFDKKRAAIMNGDYDYFSDDDFDEFMCAQEAT